ncbi:cadherin repeat domain-containing protein [Aquimarina hainanensis]|uniref:Cadherin repeat domain-containing protein n=1 Tax=Aquimarina hainanensis TaxID=1578017 RepID=A0ABW5NEC8_9FLAO|nr:cadherin repeat domain-containing protein [Aquimarina sp. TRL1]QKX06917.1 hypothetical protein HN014_19000 [Aquimarina sp. TRL1]
MLEKKIHLWGLLIGLLVVVSCSDDNSVEDQEVSITVTTEDMSFSIKENPEEGALIGMVTGSTNQGKVKFSIISQSITDAFTIEESTGKIYVKNKTIYDYEVTTTITGVVKVANGTAQKESKINIQIKDEEEVFSGEVNLKTQEEVDAFAANKYNTIAGNLHIGYTEEGDKITDIAALSSLKTITGNLQVVKNDALKTLEGLQNVTTVKVCVVYDNAMLEDISALANLNSIESIRVSSNPLLTNVNCFSKITSLRGFIEIGSNSALIDLQGLHNITTTGRSVQVFGNPQLKNLKGLEGLKEIDRLLVNSNQSMMSLEGIENLETIEEGIQIWSNENLLEIDALNKITSLTYVDINENPALNSLNGLRNVTTLSAFSKESTVVNIRKNPSLPNLEGLHNVTQINGKVVIEQNEKLEKIDGFGKVISVSGLEIGENPALYSLSGLSKLEEVTETLIIDRNTSLQSLDGLNRLTTVGKAVYIQYNDQLSDFCGVTTLAANNFPSDHIITANQFDPSLDDLKNGNCSM